MVLCALPFALTEFFFYPDYWEPPFLFSLPDRIGFGIEDLFFVAGLGAFAPFTWAVFCRRTYEPLPGNPSSKKLLAFVVPIASALVFASISFLAGVPVIWSCVGIMVTIALAMGLRRRDLLLPGLIGGLLTTAVYFAICLALGHLLPAVFELNWHAERFSNVFIAGVPLEEITYAFGAGMAATVFYPFAFSKRFIAMALTRGEINHATGL